MGYVQWERSLEDHGERGEEAGERERGLDRLGN